MEISIVLNNARLTLQKLRVHQMFYLLQKTNINEY